MPEPGGAATAEKEAAVQQIRAQVLGSLYGMKPTLATEAATALEAITQEVAAIDADVGSHATGSLAARLGHHHHRGLGGLLPGNTSSTPSRILWPSWSRLPSLVAPGEHPNALDGVLWTAIVVGLNFIAVSLVGLLLQFGTPEHPVDEDPSGFLPVPAEVYARFSARHRCWLLLREPHSGPCAFGLSAFMNLTIVVSIVSLVTESVSTYQITWPGLFELGRWYFLVVFTSEWIGVALCCPCFKKHLKEVMTWIDVAAILPSYVDTTLASVMKDRLQLLQLLRIFRLFRVIKLLGRSRQVQVIIRGLLATIPACAVGAGMVIFSVLIPAVLMYHLERGEWDAGYGCYRRRLADGALEGKCSPFRNIPQSIYWAVTTVTTVGYGDVTPVTNAGRALCAASMVFGVVAIALPIGMISNSFTMALDRIKEEEAQSKTVRQAAEQH